jgi:hypothetical protein
MSRDLSQLSATSGRLRAIGLDLELLAQTFRLDSPRSLKQLVHDWAQRLSDAPGSARRDEQELIDELVGASTFVECGCIVDIQGKVLAAQISGELRDSRGEALQELRRRNLADRPWFKKSLESSRAVVTPPVISVLSGEPCIMVAVARRDASGEPLAVFQLDVNVRHWTEIGT